MAGSELEVMRQALLDNGCDPSGMDAAAICSVVPQRTAGFQRAVATFASSVVTLDHTTPTGMRLEYHPPESLGPDRIANALGVYELFGGPSLVVDLGTATTWDVVSGDGAFLGGAIAPGLGTSSDSLFSKAARLRPPVWRVPDKVLGHSTEECLLSGTALGYAGMVDFLVERLSEEAGPFNRVVATGGMAPFVSAMARSIDLVRPSLTLEGLRAAYLRVHPV